MRMREPGPSLAPNKRPSRVSRRLADAVYVVLLWTLVLLAGWHLARHEIYWDWSSAGRNRLSNESLEVLSALEAPLKVRVFIAPEHPLVREIEQILMRYRRASDLVRVEYIDPMRAPELARQHDVRLLGQMLLEYQDRHEPLVRLDETSLTNAIARLTLTQAPWIALLEGHGERSPGGGTGRDIGRFGQWLEQRGFRLQQIDLARLSRIPSNTDVLILSTPAIALFPGEVDALMDYVAAGGNMLWLLDPGDWLGFQPLADLLGIDRLPGQIVDAAGSAFDVAAPNVAVVSDWPSHPLWQGLGAPAFFPGVAAFAPESLASLAPSWQLVTALESSAQSWNETGPIQGKIAREPELGELAGPLPFALAMTRQVPSALRAGGSEMAASALGEQRLMLIGDGDFLSNAALERGANRALGLRLLRWLSGVELVATEASPDDAPLALTPGRAFVLSVLALVVLPFGFLLLALFAYWRRRHD
ncbi:gliding-associated putative ABC transporter substrate-binding component GldG [Thiorhodovibrio winogradskyi]|uniref:Gliding-associated putative ABC transporter substrate-binding component GldG n=1 Tax=Thiorhodovibrio winogradskyi TaxID=77007 RepID=A0ABZ0SGC2_9GAMM|nr:GldG family protein [Thiorhodovibrio winogradskyi]